MNVWNNAVITDDGIALQTKLIAGNTLDITRAIAGTGYVTPGLLQSVNEVIDAKQELTFQPVTYPEHGRCKLPLTLTNDELETGYTVRMIYIMAQDPDKGEIVYAVAQSVNSDLGTIVPSASEMPGYSAEWTFYFQYGRADGVNVKVDPTGYVSREEMIAYIKTNFVPITTVEIDVAFGGTGDITGGDEEPGEVVDPDTGEGGTALYTLDHDQLYNRSMADQHPIEAITGLEDALADAEGTALDTTVVETAWEDATTEAEAGETENT